MTLSPGQPAAGIADIAGRIGLWIVLRVPLLPMVAGLCAGIVADRCRPAPWYLYTILFMVAGGLLWRAFRTLGRGASLWALVAVFTAAAGVGALRHQVDFWRAEPTHVLMHVRGPTSLARLRGTILDEPVVRRPEPTPYGIPIGREPRTRFVLACEEVLATQGWVPCSGLVRVRVQGGAAHLRAHDRVEFFASLRIVDPPANPGEHDWQLHQRRNGICVQASVARPEGVTRLPAQGHAVARRLAAFRAWGRGVLLDGLDPEDETSGLLATYIAGQRGAVTRQIDDAFRLSGTAHLLAVSGAHVALIAAGAWFFGRIVLRRPRRVAPLVLATVVFYGLLVEPNPPAVRAAIGASLGVTAILLGRPLSGPNWLAASACVLLLANPLDLFAAGFQLSFIAVAALLVATPNVRQLVFGPHSTAGWVRERIRRRDWPGIVYTSLEYLRTVASVSLTAWLAASPLLAYHFGVVNVWGAAATILIAPIAGLALYMGFGKLLISLVLPSAGALLAWPLSVPAQFMAALAGWLSALPAATVEVRTPPVWQVTLVYALLLLWRAMTHRRWQADVWQAASAAAVEPADAAASPDLRPPRPPHAFDPPNQPAALPWQPVYAHAVALVAVGLLFGYGISANPDPPPSHPQIHVLSVGDGLAVVVRSPNGRNLLYDAGSLSLNTPGESIVVPALRALGIERIHAAILSHANLDHYNAMPAVARALPVEQVITTEAFLEAADSGAARRLLRDLRALGVPVTTCRRGDRITGFEPLELTVLWPQDPPLAPPDANDASIVLRVDSPNGAALLTGDIGREPQLRLLGADPDRLRADLLVLPHHGSPASLVEPFIAATAASASLASTGDGDRVARLGQAFAGLEHVLSTAGEGMISVEFGPDGLAAKSFRPARPLPEVGRIDDTLHP